jgi:hypothetical protein
MCRPSMRADTQVRPYGEFALIVVGEGMNQVAQASYLCLSLAS